MSIFTRIKSALSKTSDAIVKVTENITKKGIDSATIEELEEVMLYSDFGVEVTDQITAEIRKFKIARDEGQSSFRNHLKSIIEEIMKESSKPLELKDGVLNIILFCGVNGNGKTTTIGKLAHLYRQNGKKVMVAACDTFRSAAVDQLRIWSDRSGADIVFGEKDSDPASVAYSAAKKAQENNYDILLIDTAGRLQNKLNLMEELGKIMKVIKKTDPDFPNHIILTLDSCSGQNLNRQIEGFLEILPISGIIFTKLDGTARGGAIIGIIQKYHLPIHYITIGEGLEDIVEFDHKDFVSAILE